jgi:hypothetical protein
MAGPPDPPSAAPGTLLGTEHQAVAPYGSYVRLSCQMAAENLAQFESPVRGRGCDDAHGQVTARPYSSKGLGPRRRGPQRASEQILWRG